MRIQRLSLLAYGPFHDRTLDFAAPGLHLVFGPNEAGKSTTLRAITALLYGIDRTTRDAHLHKPADLRFGGTLISEGGEVLRVVRRKGVSKGGPNTLLDESGKAMDDAKLVGFLRGMNEETFRHAFGLDHETLARGAEALLAGRGELGESLFDASVGGGGDVQRLLAELDQEAEKIYAPRGSTRPLNEALKAFADAQRRIKERQTLPEAHAQQEHEIARLMEARAKATAERTALARTRSSLERAKSRAPLLRRRAHLLAAWEPLAPVAEALRAAGPLLSSLERVDHDIDERAKLDQELAAIASRLGELSRAPKAGEPVDQGREARIRRLCQERTEADAALRVAKNDLVRLEAEAVALRSEGASERRDEGDVALLARALEQARDLGNAERRLVEEEARSKRRRVELDERVALLGAFSGDARKLARQRLPAAAVVEGFVARLRDLDESARRARVTIDERRAEQLANERQLAAHTGDFAPPTVDALRAARDARDGVLELLRGSRAGEDQPKLLARLERAVRDADDLADRMIREADRVTTVARLRSEGALLQQQIEGLEDERRRLDERRGELLLEHERAWEGVDLARVDEPAAMKAWLDAATRDVGAHGELVEAEARVEELRAAIERAEGDLRDAYRRCGDQPLRDGSLASALAAASRVLEAVASRERSAEIARKQLAKVETSLLERRALIGAHEGRAEEIGRALAPLLVPLGLDVESSNEEIDAALEASRSVAGLSARRREIEQRRAALDARITTFEADVAALAAQVAPSLTTRRPRDAAEELGARALRVRDLDRELASNTTALDEIGDAPLPTEFADAAEDPDALAAALEVVEEAFAERQREIEALTEKLGAVQAGLKAMQAESGAAEAALEAEEALARVRSQAERYARAKLSSWVLGREIARYREANQGPVLAATSTFFAQLTEGAFEGVRVGFGEKDEPTLQCVRRGGAHVEIAGLSEGTRDQLYLALRLASLLRYADTGATMPLVLDDLLVQFDDERSRAALRVLAGVSDRLQVLFFTHHRRLVELAREAVPKSLLHVHELSPRHAPASASEALPGLENPG